MRIIIYASSRLPCASSYLRVSKRYIKGLSVRRCLTVLELCAREGLCLGKCVGMKYDIIPSSSAWLREVRRTINKGQVRANKSNLSISNTGTEQ